MQIISKELHNELLKLVSEISNSFNDSFNPKKYDEFLINQFSTTFHKLYDQCSIDNFVWEHCPFELYKDNYDSKLNEHLLMYKDSTEKNFIYVELNELNKSYLSYNDLSNFFVSLLEDIPGSELIGMTSQISAEINFYEARKPIIPLNLFLKNPLLENVIYSKKRKIEFLESKINALKDNFSNPNDSRIFAAPEYKVIFEKLLKEIGAEYSDICFIYRKMFSDKYIYERSESEFRKWYEKNYPNLPTINSRLQSLEHVNTKYRLSLYNKVTKVSF